MNEIKKHIASAISISTNEPTDSILTFLEKPKNTSHGDLAFPCFSFAKKNSLNPQSYAAELKNKIKPDNIISEIIQIGPFLNFKINFKEISNKIIHSAQNLKNYPSNNLTYIVEYSSPNIAKPFHVGHLRATLIGNCLDRLYSFLGYNVESINHLGDWGTQFGYVYAGCKMWGEPSEFTVKTLVDLYKKATTLKEEEEKNNTANNQDSVTQIARNYFLRLEANEPDAINFWKRCVDSSLIYLKNTYDRLGITFKHYLGESYYSDKIESLVSELIEKNILTESQGAKGVDLGEELGFARTMTPDGRSLYLTRDLAAAEYRHKRFNFKKCIYVVGAPQTLHFKQLKEILRLAKKTYYNEIEHIPFGHVLGMKTRGEGQSIELNEFIDEAISRALNAYQTQVEKRPTEIDVNMVSKKVALSAIIFSTLNRNNIKDVHFNWDEALSFQGDSGPYLLYAYARLNSIEEKAKKEQIQPSQEVNFDSINFDSAKEILIKLLEFDNVLHSAAYHNEPLHLCTYCLELSKAISKAYLDLKVIGASKEDAESRLALFIAAKKALKTSLNILGIDTLEKM